jgi:hypothetical protein
MYLSLTNIVKSVFTSPFTGKVQKSTASDSESSDHAYIRGDITNRGPCPGLNALANQGYLYEPSLLLFAFSYLTDTENNKAPRWEESHHSASGTRPYDRLTHEQDSRPRPR